MSTTKSNEVKSAKNFLLGAMILSGANIVVKIIGALYKIPLYRMLGGDGMGYYNSAYNFYALLFVISTAGIPVAISKLVSESIALNRLKEPKKILQIAVITFSIVGFIGMMVMFFGANMFVKSIENPEAKLSVIMFAPAVFFVSLTAAFKGYYQGHKNMTPTAIYQILEASSKLFGLIFVSYLAFKKYPLNVVASGAVLGVTAGALISSLFMFLRFLLGRKERVPADIICKPNRASSAIFKQMLIISIPVTLGSAVSSMTSFIDTILMMNRLNSISEIKAVDGLANFYYGAYSGLSQTMFNLPATVILPISISVLPFIASAFALKDKRTSYKNMGSSLTVTSLLCAPCALGMSVMAGPILWLLFSSRPEDVLVATPTLRLLALSIFLVCLVQLSNSILQAVGKAHLPIIAMIIGAFVKIITNYTLIGIPEININGAPIGTILCYTIILVINLFNIWRVTTYKPSIMQVFVKPLISGIVCAAGALVSYRFLYMKLQINPSIVTAFSLCIAGLIYLIMIFAIRAVNEDVILLLPRGEKLAQILKSRKLIK